MAGWQRKTKLLSSSTPSPKPASTLLTGIKGTAEEAHL